MEKLINKWKLNKGLLAKKIDMPLGTFCNKLSSKHSSEFSDDELIKLKLVLREINADIANEIDIDFNDALAMLIKVKPVEPQVRIKRESKG